MPVSPSEAAIRTNDVLDAAPEVPTAPTQAAVTANEVAVPTSEAAVTPNEVAVAASEAAVAATEEPSLVCPSVNRQSDGSDAFAAFAVAFKSLRDQ